MKYYVGFEGYLEIEAESKEEAENIFWETAHTFETNYKEPVEGGLIKMLGVDE